MRQSPQPIDRACAKAPLNLKAWRSPYPPPPGVSITNTSPGAISTEPV